MNKIYTLMLIAIGMMAAVHAQTESLQPTIVAVQPYVVMNTDSQAVVVTDEAVGIVGTSVFCAISEFENKENLYIGNSAENNGFKGIIVTDGGETVLILASKIIIIRPSFNSHAEADAQLTSGQEYYLNGDRGVYRKP